MINYKNSSCSRDILKGCRPKRHINSALVTGKDVITNSDGKGSIQIDGVTLGYGVANGKGWAFDLGGGVYAGMAVYEDATSPTGKKLIIKKRANTVCQQYKNSSWLSSKYIGYRAKKHVKTSYQGVRNA